MERHPTDFVELFFGLAFVATGTGFVVRQLTDRTFDPVWIAAIALVAIGCAFLSLTLMHRPRPQAAPVPTVGRPETPLGSVDEPELDEPQ